jgi:hypothetical protein
MALFLIIPVLVLFYGGGFALPFTYYRFRKHLPVQRCLTNGFLGLILFFFIVTTIADLGTAAIHGQSWLYMIGMIGFLALPYALSGLILVQHYRKKKDGTGSGI